MAAGSSGRCAVTPAPDSAAARRRCVCAALPGSEEREGAGLPAPAVPQAVSALVTLDLGLPDELENCGGHGGHMHADHVYEVHKSLLHMRPAWLFAVKSS